MELERIRLFDAAEEYIVIIREHLTK